MSTRERARTAYHTVRKSVLRTDIHEKVTRVTLRHIARYQHATPYVQGKKKILDVACGSGYGAMLLGVSNYLGVDLDERAVRAARTQFPEFNYEVGSVFDLPAPRASFDAVISFETLEHVEAPEQAITEFRRVLRPDGIVIGSIPINHPDTVYHVRPYSALDAFSIFTSCPGLLVTDLLVQRDLDFSPILEHDLTRMGSGTLIAVLAAC